MEREKTLEISLKHKVILVFFGVFFALLLLLPVVYWVVSKNSGSHYRNLSELRAAMIERNEKDLKEDRSVSLRSIIQPNSSDSIIYELKPNLNVKFQGVNVVTNSFGMRNPEISVEKPLGYKRVALIGDSFAFGWGVEENKIFARVIEEELNKKNPKGDKYEVLNFGVPGYSTFQEVDAFEEKALKFKPDIVIVYFVDNDWGLPFFLGGNEDSTLMSAVDFAKNVWESESPEDKAQKRFLQSIMNPNRSLKKLVELSDKYNFKVGVCINPGKNYDQDRRRLWILNKEPKISEIQIRDKLKKIIEEQNIDKSTLSLPTDPHPSELKHRLMGELIVEQIRDW